MDIAWGIIIFLMFVWFMGVVTSHLFGGFLHVLAIIALATLFMKLLRS